MDCDEIIEVTPPRLIVPEKAAPYIDRLNITVTTQDEESPKGYSYSVTPNGTYFIETLRGVNYTVSVTGRGPDESWTSQICNKSISTRKLRVFIFRLKVLITYFKQGSVKVGITICSNFLLVKLKMFYIDFCHQH